MRRRLPLVLCLLLGGALHGADERPAELIREKLNVGFAEGAFYGLHRNDAEAAVKVFARTAGTRRGYALDITVEVFKAVEEIRGALDEGRVDLLFLDTWTYLDLDRKDRVEPVFVSSDGNEVTKRQLILTRKDGGLTNLASLQGKALVLFQGPNANLGPHWLQVLLGQENLQDPDRYFSRLDITTKPASAVLPVFFRQKDACLVDSAGFSVLTELNPQVGSALQAIVTSEPLLSAVIGVRRGAFAPSGFRPVLIEVLADLHSDPGGQQVLTLFRSSRLQPFSEDLLASVRDLKTVHQRLASPGGHPTPLADGAVSQKVSPPALERSKGGAEQDARGQETGPTATATGTPQVR